MQKIKVLFVCMGNICRSPTAEGVFRQLVREEGLSAYFEVDSAGVSGGHAGQAPDPRTQAAAKERGIDLAKLRARKVDESDFAYFDYILAMDRDNLAYLQHKCPPELGHKLGLLLSHAPALGLDEVPDPYYGARNGFARVLELVWLGSAALLENLRAQHELR
ncbi:MAG: low molecular weight phosphotyrosine protein phosphatase [Gammaproteobacteria bacterium]|nr:low molecular weight phosphotyrosine protein phosphatase [Gammaproteobacteria bacterium]